MHSSCRRGFTLVELMIVVAIVAILSVIAVPNFLRYQLRARSTEMLTHLKGIATAEGVYYTEHGTYVSVIAPVPATLPSTSRLPWPNGTAFDTIGWRPDGGVVSQYAVNADDPNGSGALTRFTAEARADLDADGVDSFFAYVRPVPGFGGLAGSLPGTTCDGTGVFGSGGTNSFDTPGACDTTSGRSKF